MPDILEKLERATARAARAEALAEKCTAADWKRKYRQEAAEAREEVARIKADVAARAAEIKRTREERQAPAELSLTEAAAVLKPTLTVLLQEALADAAGNGQLDALLDAAVARAFQRYADKLVVNVQPQITVPPAEVQVNVEPAPVQLAHVPMRKSVERDQQGRVAAIVEEPM